ncbi:MAG: hypothetical protein V7K50_10800 [Nostoc sp.]|uniref:hypothetical protein n=1 Tax=Nostoc sp. TaxID=1180 RepID=UPI002FFAFAE8
MINLTHFIGIKSGGLTILGAMSTTGYTYTPGLELIHAEGMHIILYLDKNIYKLLWYQ